MNNFTKEYIKECDCEAIQKLKATPGLGDWIIRENNIMTILLANYSWIRKDIIWLPTGDQSDEEIVKIIDKNKNLDYKFTRQGMTKKCYAEITDYSIHSASYYIVHSENSPNPLIAKIKLLKQLLK